MVNRIGEKFNNFYGCAMEIINYKNAKNCTIKFEDGTILKNIQYIHIKNGVVKNPYYSSVFGKGYIGEGDFIKCVKGKQTKVYRSWNRMLERCYSKKWLTNNPTYKDCSVDERWYNLQVFAEWFENNYVEDYALDKDILIKGNKVYSSETCCFVPQEINSLFIKSNKSRGDLPIGVSRNGEKFKAEVSIGHNKKEYLGTFDTPEEAFTVYKKAKETYIKELAEKYKPEITPKCYQALINYKVEIND